MARLSSTVVTKQSVMSNVNFPSVWSTGEFCVVTGKNFAERRDD